jgi:hypothetical protein
MLHFLLRTVSHGVEPGIPPNWFKKMRSYADIYDSEKTKVYPHMCGDTIG